MGGAGVGRLGSTRLAWTLLFAAAGLAIGGASARAATTPGSVAGTVTDAAGQPLAGICVGATSFSGSGGSASTDSSGRYTLPNLTATTSPSTQWRIQFSDCSNHVYATEWFDGKASESDATSVQVSEGQTTTGVDARLPLAGSIAGTVTDAAGNPLSGICVVASPTATGSRVGNGSTTSDADGHYTITGVPPGSYLVRFNCSATRYLDQWYAGAVDPAASTQVAVAAGATTTGIDAALEMSASISGTVTDVQSHPLGNICVSVSSAPGTPKPVAGGATTDGSGKYEAVGLPAGSYTVSFRECFGHTYARQWFNGRSTPTGADTVNVTAGQSMSSIDAVLHVDSTAPTISVPSDITVTTSGSSATVTYTVSFSDPDDDVASSSCVPASGSAFPLGTTVVNCTASDLNGNPATASFHVIVNPEPAPPQPSPSPPAAGGGGGGIPPDLHLDVTASAQTAPAVGSELDYVIVVSSKNVGGSSDTTLKLTLPAGYVVTGVFRDRGPGCTGTPPDLTCNVAFINSSTSTHLRITGTVGVAGEQDLTAVVNGYPEPEFDATDNTVTLKLLPAAPTGPSRGTFTPPTASRSNLGTTLRPAAPRWNGAATHIRYQWQLCTPAGCRTIAGANRPTLKLVAAYAGKSVRRITTATINSHTVTKTSTKTAVRA